MTPPTLSAALHPYRLQEITIRVQRAAGPALHARDISSIVEAFRHITEEPRESLFGLYLDSTGQILAYERVSTGTLLSTDADPSEIARAALIIGATGVILLHNHLTIPTPSPDDREITQDAVTALHLFGISLIDHVILAPHDQYFSFYVAGELPLPQPLTPARIIYALTWHDPTSSTEPILAHAALTPEQASTVARHLHDLVTAGKIARPAITPLPSRPFSCKALLRQHPLLRSSTSPQLPLETPGCPHRP